MLGRTALDYLRAAGCDHAIVVLPVPEMTIGPKPGVTCPERTPEYVQSESLLKAAMKRAVR